MVAQVGTKKKLSGSTDGKGIKIVNTATLGNQIHQAVAGTSSMDEIWLYAYNGYTSPVLLTVEWGEATVPDGNIVMTLPAKAGRYQVVDGRLLQNALNVTAFANVTNVIVIDGFCNSIV